ncbi:MAG: polyprenyl synthetase family protein [Eubacterium sp.]|jgi:Geranylgeranyl pyrophosphate synthase|nr:polyprenyl synthetase family protein [Eubacterium sp.]
MTTAYAYEEKRNVSFSRMAGKIKLSQKKDQAFLYERLQAEIQKMEQMLLSACGESGGLAGECIRRIIASGGKRLRPSLAWVCYSMASGGNGRKTAEILPLMCMLEMMHTASLIHDDVVDDAGERRNVPTIHTQHGTRFAVQCGDYLLAKAMEYLHIYRGMGINEVLSDTSRQMCLGEFRQMAGLYSLKEQTPESYEIQIRQKTAYLLGASCYCGALAGGMEKEQAEKLRWFGESLGRAFQLEDDLLDFAPDAKSGKPAGQDIKNGIFTMPALYVMHKDTNREIACLLEKREKTEEEITRILNYIERNGGIRYTKEQIRLCSRKAIDSLDGLPDTVEKKVLCEMVQKLIERRT